MTRRSPLFVLFLAILTLAMSGGAMALPISIARIQDGVTEIAHNEAYNQAVATGIVQRTYQGITSAGDPADMLVTGQAYAYASYSFMKASAQSSIENVLNSPSNPDSYSAYAAASIYDTLTIGNPNVTSIKFGIHVDGTLERTWPSSSPEWVQSLAGAAVYLRQDNVGIWSRQVGQGNSFDDYVMTNAMTVSGGRAQLHFSLIVDTIFSPTHFEQAADGGSFSASAMFENTALLVEVYGYDNAGMRVASAGVRSSDSAAFFDAPVASVPEPDSLAMMVFGLIVVLASSRRLFGQRRSIRGFRRSDPI